MSKKLLQIDTCLGVGSTGRITESIAQLAQSQGWDCYIIHGARYVKRPSCMKDIQTVSKMGEYLHYAEGLVFDNHGLASRTATRCVVERIKEIRPDIIHLHCIHGYYLNYKYLFEYLNTTNIPVVWTFHDCWAFTGHCAYFDSINCEKWKTGCNACELKGTYPKSILLDRSKRNYELKRSLFTAREGLTTIVPVSFWLEGLVKRSFLKNIRVKTIHNGTNVEIFTPMNTGELRKKLNIGERKIILGVALPWVERKGLPDMLKLAELLPHEEYQIILVGLNQKQVDELPHNVIGVMRTNNAKELAEYYSMATAFVNPTYEDNFPTTNIEALACGTPVVTYRTGGSPEAADERTGRVVDQGDIVGLRDAILELGNIENVREKCRERAVSLYDANTAFNEYVALYEELLTEHPGGAIYELIVYSLRFRESCYAATFTERRLAA